MKRSINHFLQILLAVFVLHSQFACTPADAHRETIGPEPETEQPDHEDHGEQTGPEQVSILQKIKDGAPGILDVKNEKSRTIVEGLLVTEGDLLVNGRTGKVNNHLFVIQVDLDKSLSFRTSTPDDRPFDGKQQDMVAQAAAADRNGHKVLLGVNGDCYGGYGGHDYNVPKGVHVVDGKDISQSERCESVFYLTRKGEAFVSTLSDFKVDKEQVFQAIGLWHRLVWDGEKIPLDSFKDDMMFAENPRTFMGITKDRKQVLLFVVDGRQGAYSKGLGVKDMMDICLSAGCYRACNMDGGGSTTLVTREENDGKVRFVVQNRPSDGAPRKVVNGLLVVSK